MAEVASAYVSLVPSAKGFGRATEQQVGGEMKSTGAKLGGILGRGMKAGAIGVLGGLALGGVFLKGAIADASDLAESTSKVGVVFGKQAGQILKASRTSATAMGLSKNAYLDATGTLGNLLVSLDIAPKKSAVLSKQMVKLAGDLASFNNASPEEALEALKSGLTGETEPLKRFGVNMNESTLKAEALRKGLIKNTKEALDPQTKALAAQSLIMRQTKTAQGDFARTSGGLANQQRILSAQFANVKAKLGRVLLPVATRVFRFLNDTGIPALAGVKDAFRNLRDPIGKVAGKVGTVAGAVKDFFTKGEGESALKDAFDHIRTTVGKISDKLGDAKDAIGGMKDAASGFSLGDVDANALGKSIGEALITALGFLADSAGQIAEKIGELFGSIDWVGIGITMGQQAPALLLGLVTGILNFDIGSLLSGIGDHWFEILMGILTIAFLPAKFIGPLTKMLTKIPFVGRFLAAAVTWISKLGTKITNFGKDLFRSFTKGFGAVKFPGSGIIRKVLDALKGLPGRIKNFVDTLATRLGVWALDAFEAMGRGARKAVTKLVSFVGTIGGKVLRGIGKLGDLLKPVGEAIVNGLKNGISGAWHFVTDKVQELINKIPAKIRKLLGISSPSKVTRRIGEQTGQGLADGLASSGRRVEDSARKVGDKAVKRLKASLAKYTTLLEGLRSKAAEISSSVRDAFRPDLFSGSLGDLVGGLAGGLANVQAALAALPKLAAAGIKGDFLNQLLASGNASLIASLAGSPTQAKALQAQFNQLQSLSGTLGTRAANTATSADIASVTRELQHIKKLLARAPKANGRETANALNHTAAAAKRRRKVA